MQSTMRCTLAEGVASATWWMDPITRMRTQAATVLVVSCSMLQRHADVVIYDFLPRPIRPRSWVSCRRNGSSMERRPLLELKSGAARIRE